MTFYEYRKNRLNCRLNSVVMDDARHPKNETIEEHMRHCRAEKRCPFTEMVGANGGTKTESEKHGSGTPSSGRTSFDITSLPSALSSCVTSTTVSYLKLGKTKDRHVFDRHSELMSSGDIDGAKEYAIGLASNESTRDAGDYMLAKYHRDSDAAGRVVMRCLKKGSVEQLNANLDHSRPIVLIPLTNVEGSGLNRIPIQYANILSKLIPGSTICGDVVKTSKAHNTGASANDRAKRSFEFNGDIDVSSDPQIVIVDDTWTSGQTCVSMVAYLKSLHPNLRFAGVTTLASGRYGHDVIPSDQKISKVLEKAGLANEEEFETACGFKIRSRTGSELQGYILNGRRGIDGLKERFSN